MELNIFMEQGIRSILSAVSNYYLFNEKGRRFLKPFSAALKDAAGKRKEVEKRGLHVPPFLIASITSSCNLHCTGCYARAGGLCTDEAASLNMTDREWDEVFRQAAGLGVSFILLAGGEPFLRPEVIRLAAGYRQIAFPVFTNATLFNEAWLKLFDECRNLIPVVSMEGDSARTDERRGVGVAEQICEVMGELKKRGILFAVSVTVTGGNLEETVNAGFVRDLEKKGCGVLFFVEYVPAEKGTEALALTKEQVGEMADRVADIKRRQKKMAVLSFPGDEQHMGGCLAAGRGFFHINPGGGAEPCPFSPFSGMNLKKNSMAEVLSSAFFRQVREIEMQDNGHEGGCVLFRYEKEVRSLLDGGNRLEDISAGR